MALTRPDSRQIINRGALGNIGAAAGTTQDSLNSKFNTEVNSPLRLAATFPTADSKLNFTASLVSAADGAQKAMPPVSSQVFESLVAATIDFQTQTISAPSQFTITWPSPNNVGQFRRAGFTLTAAGTIQVLFTAEAASEGALADAGTLIVTGIPLGYINLQCTNSSGFFKTAGSATNIIENAKIFRFGTGGGAGSSGSGSGTGDDLDSLLFRASFNDGFDEIPSSTNSAVDVTAAHTDAAAYSAAKTLYQLNYDASKTIAAATTTTTINLSAVASFTVKTGDMVISGSQARRITAVGSQSSFTVDAFDVAPTLASQVTVSQAVHTKDIYNLAVDGSALSAAFSGATFSEIMVDYEDTTTVADSIFDVNVAPVIAFSASHNGTSFTNNQVRPTLETTTITSVNLSAAGTSLYLRFFANKTSGSGSVNILRYKAFMQKDANASTGGATGVSAWSALAFTNSVGTPVNCTVGLVGGKTTITLTNGLTYAVGANSGSPYGTLDVFLNGVLIPRFINSTLTPDGSYLETSPTIITLDKDYSFLNLSVQVILRSAVIDTTSQNVSNISAIQEAIQNGMQGFVNTSNLMTATTSAGTPVAGSFYSTIVGRSSMVDLTQDLKPRMGIERLIFQQPVKIVNEYGTNGEAVWGVYNDALNQIRLVGDWSSPLLLSSTDSGLTVKAGSLTDYMEVTFYGTGLNLLVDYQNYLFTSATYNVDGGSNQTVTGVAASAVLQHRFYSPNQVLPITAGLTLGVHTVKILIQTSDVFGCEILNESSSLKIQPGVGYVQGKKIVTTAQSVQAYNSTFDSGVMGTRGGRVVVYQKSDGTIGKSVQPVGSQQNTTSVDHSLEEVVRVHSFREFGAGRFSANDDFSTVTNTTSNRAFTLDDGTTTLTGSGVQSLVASDQYGEGLACVTTNNYIFITFVGTGLDIVNVRNNATYDTHTIFLDGVSTVTNFTAWGTGKSNVVRLFSGLAYGTHTVRIVRTANAQVTPDIKEFIVYQPKKPAIPTGAIELGDYNVMANYTVDTTGTLGHVSPGVLRKVSPREMTYVGTWTFGATDPTKAGGFNVQSSTSGNYVEYIFFGTGFELRHESGATFTVTVSLQNLTAGGSLQTLNSTNFPGLTTTNIVDTFNYSTGALTGTAGGNDADGFSVNGLTLGTYKVRLALTSSNSFKICALDIITPIYSTKSNIYSDFQNTMMVGSNAIFDGRKTTPVKDLLPAQKSWSQAIGVTSDPTTTSNTPVPITDMSLMVRVGPGSSALEVEYSIEVQNTSTGNNGRIYIYVDGVVWGPQKDYGTTTAGERRVISDTLLIPASPGFHKVDAYWATGAGTLSATGNRRNIRAREI